MSVAVKHIRMPKPYLLEVLDEYKEIENNIGAIILASGYKTEFIARKLKMPLSTFCLKRKNKSFTSKEVAQIVRMLDDDDNNNNVNYTAEENAELLKWAKSRKNDEKTSATDFLNFLAK
jgi:YesN/AraC family two-component response regulator